MKILKSLLLLTCVLCFTVNLSQAQNKLYSVHVDYVKPSKIMEYEKIAEEFKAACEEHNPETSWLTATTGDLRYMYVTPIKSMADLDHDPFNGMAEKMGDSFGDMFTRFNKCYDKHGDYVIVLDEDLTYMPEGVTQTPEGENFRKFFFMYYTPENGSKLRKGMKAVKEMFASKGSKSHYRVYRSAFGVIDSYYMVAISAKDEIAGATNAKANDELLGPERYETFNKVMNHITRMEEVSGSIRPDLSYKHKKTTE